MTFATSIMLRIVLALSLALFRPLSYCSVNDQKTNVDYAISVNKINESVEINVTRPQIPQNQCFSDQIPVNSFKEYKSYDHVIDDVFYSICRSNTDNNLLLQIKDNSKSILYQSIIDNQGNIILSNGYTSNISNSGLSDKASFAFITNGTIFNEGIANFHEIVLDCGRFINNGSLNSRLSTPKALTSDTI